MRWPAAAGSPISVLPQLDRGFCVTQRAHITHLSRVTAPGKGASNDLLLGWSWHRHLCETTDFPLVYVHADTGDLGVGGNSCALETMPSRRCLSLTDNLLVSAGAHRLTLGAHGELLNLPTHYNLSRWILSQLALPEYRFAGIRRSGQLRGSSRIRHEREETFGPFAPS